MMDRVWAGSFLHCFDMYPPSFYYLHTPEEQDEILKRDVERIKKKIDLL